MLSVIHNTRIITCTTNFNEAKNNYQKNVSKRVIWVLFSIQGLGEADHSDRDFDSTGDLLKGQVPLLPSGELQWKRGSGEVYQ